MVGATNCADIKLFTPSPLDSQLHKHVTHTYQYNDGYIYGGNMTVSHSHPYSLCHIPTWWEYDGWEYAGKPYDDGDMMMVI